MDWRRCVRFQPCYGKKNVASKIALNLQLLAGATLVAVQITSPAQAKAEVSFFKQLTAFSEMCTNRALGWLAGSTQECYTTWTTCCH